MKFILLVLAVIGTASAGFVAPAFNGYPAPVVTAAPAAAYPGAFIKPVAYSVPTVTATPVSAYSASFVKPLAYGAPGIAASPDDYSAQLGYAGPTVSPIAAGYIAPVNSWKKKASA
ncbi:unnamed protein product [Hermetia illucens]|uniref:Uncharacterized protein n=1 Tax=Hermetia illucens TaxID=343691 RepID=A0A7R8YQ23_HERIL|nr:cuticle protein 12.5-like [Hermetia illucens]CAD7080926.1 unnamed protein product [Hermetia illucens]